MSRAVQPCASTRDHEQRGQAQLAAHAAEVDQHVVARRATR